MANACSVGGLTVYPIWQQQAMLPGTSMYNHAVVYLSVEDQRTKYSSPGAEWFESLPFKTRELSASHSSWSRIDLSHDALMLALMLSAGRSAYAGRYLHWYIIGSIIELKSSTLK